MRPLRQPGTYQAFVQDLSKHSNALSKLYLLLILHLLGVAADELHRIVYYPNPFEFRSAFEGAGLIVEQQFAR
ncbi:hypothetical protein DCO48_04175 [Pseudomonas sp. SDI]|nr:hypothetical protein DCO48_04175 [Pseudomonas sp. SDI]